jgi:hypothetical protein
MKAIFAGTFIIGGIFMFLTGIIIGYTDGRHDSKLISPEPCTTIHAITMPENAFEQLKNSSMIQIKILRE